MRAGKWADHSGSALPGSALFPRVSPLSSPLSRLPSLVSPLASPLSRLNIMLFNSWAFLILLTVTFPLYYLPIYPVS